MSEQKTCGECWRFTPSHFLPTFGTCYVISDGGGTATSRNPTSTDKACEDFEPKDKD